MIQKILLFILGTLFIVACDLRQPPDEDAIDRDAIYDETPIYNEETSQYPNDIEKFNDLLTNSKYQFPDSSTTVEYDQFDGYKTENFYVNEDDDFFFVVKKQADSEKIRNELREGPESREWNTTDSDGNFWVSTLKCYKPKVGVSTYTWMQVHGTNDTFDYPLIRLLWVRSRHSIYDHIWAIVIISSPDADERVYEWLDLGERPTSFFDAAVYIQDNIMKVKIHNKVIKEYDVSYWENVTNYFKAGIYLNAYEDGGEGVVAFRELRFLDWADPDYVTDSD